MVFITGDIHGDIERFTDKKFRSLTENDTVIVCGDFGFFWNNSDEELKAREKLRKLPFRILFVLGINDNAELLKPYRQEFLGGGVARRIYENLFMLESGEFYNIGGKTFFAVGGGDISDYISGDELPVITPPEKAYAEKAAKEYGGKVDFVVTHEAPNSVKQFLDLGERSFGGICELLDKINGTLEYGKWFFGKYHIDRPISYKMQAVYNALVPLGEADTF